MVTGRSATALSYGILWMLEEPYRGGFARGPHLPSWPDEWRMFASLSNGWRVR